MHRHFVYLDEKIDIFKTSHALIIHERLDFNTQNNENTVPFGVFFKTFIIITNFFYALQHTMTYVTIHYDNALHYEKFSILHCRLYLSMNCVVSVFVNLILQLSLLLFF